MADEATRPPSTVAVPECIKPATDNPPLTVAVVRIESPATDNPPPRVVSPETLKSVNPKLAATNVPPTYKFLAIAPPPEIINEPVNVLVA